MFIRTRAGIPERSMGWCQHECLLNFHDSVLVTVFLRHSELVIVFLADAIVSQVCAWSRLSLSIRHRIRFALTMCCSFWNCLRFMVHSTRCHRWISSVFQTIGHRTRCLFACADSHALHPGVGVHRFPDFHIITIMLEIRRSCIELDDCLNHCSSFSTHRRTVHCTHDMHNEMFIAFLCATNPH